MTTVTVDTSNKYNVYIGGGLLSEAGERIAEAVGAGEQCPPGKAVIVTDDTVDGLYGRLVEGSLKAVGFNATRFVFPNGEKSKNINTYSALLNYLAKANLTRSDVVVALGGGVVGDMAGFAAATYLRGIKFVQIPTTLLAMVDSSVGGKTGVNLEAGKNQVGAFYQPSVVLCDYRTLETLPQEVFRDGCAEMIKHSVIRDTELFEMLNLLDLSVAIPPDLEIIIARNVAIKRDVVAVDERDVGIRQVLNFGHTIGHGIEKHSDYTLTHGKAVAIGMSIASRGAFRMGLCSEECHLQIRGILERYQLPVTTSLSAEQLFQAAFSDKKRSGGQITLVVPEKIGNCYLKSFSMDELAEFIRIGMADN